VQLPGNPENTYQLPGLGLGLKLWKGEFEGMEDVWLRWLDDTGSLIPTGAELAAMEQARAEAEYNRASRLAKLLRQHGIDPDQ